MPVASITTTLTQAVGDYGLYAVFLLMMIDAVFPAGSEIVMVYGGAIASGAIAGSDVTLFGYTFASGLPAYLAIVTAGTVGYLVGSIIGWEIGIRGGRRRCAGRAGCASGPRCRASSSPRRGRRTSRP